MFTPIKNTDTIVLTYIDNDDIGIEEEKITIKYKTGEIVTTTNIESIGDVAKDTTNKQIAIIVNNIPNNTYALAITYEKINLVPFKLDNIDKMREQLLTTTLKIKKSYRKFWTKKVWKNSKRFSKI